MLLAERVAAAERAEAVAADRNPDAVGDREGLSNQLVVACVRQRPRDRCSAARCERCPAARATRGGCVVGRVLEARLVAVFPDQSAVRRARAEARECEVAPEVVAAQEADLGIEVVLDNQTIDLQPVAIGVVVELPAIAQVIAVQAGRPRLGDVACSARGSDRSGTAPRRRRPHSIPARLWTASGG